MQSVKELAKKLNVSAQAIRDEAKKQGIEPQTVGKAFMFDEKQSQSIAEHFARTLPVQDSAAGKIKALETELADLKQALSAVGTEKQQLENENTLLKAEIDHLKAFAETSEKSHEEMKTLLVGQISQLQEQINKLDAQLKDAQTNVKQAQLLHLNAQQRLLTMTDPAPKEVVIEPEPKQEEPKQEEPKQEEPKPPRKHWFEFWK